MRVKICISALFLLPHGKVQHRGLAPGDSVPYVLHFLHMLGADNSISRFTASLIFLPFVSLSLPPPVVYTFYLICAFKIFFFKHWEQFKTYNKNAQEGKMEGFPEWLTAKFSPLENLLTEAWNFHRCLGSARVAWLTCSAALAIQNIFVGGSECGKGLSFTALQNANQHSHFQKGKIYTKTADPHVLSFSLSKWSCWLRRGHLYVKGTAFGTGSVVWSDFRRYTSIVEAGPELCLEGATWGTDRMGHAAAVLCRAPTAVVLAREGEKQGNKTIRLQFWGYFCSCGAAYLLLQEHPTCKGWFLTHRPFMEQAYSPGWQRQ